MNSKQRRNRSHSKTKTRRANLTYLTVAGVLGGSFGMSTPAHAADYVAANCTDFLLRLNDLVANGGTLTADFSGTCELTQGYLFQLPSAINGPTNGDLNLKFMNPVNNGFIPFSTFSISNLNFTRESDTTPFQSFIYSYQNDITVNNSNFSNAEVQAAIYAEGNLTVSDSTFANLYSYNGGPAMYLSSGSTTEITNSTFVGNKALGQASGGAIYSEGAFSIKNSTFHSNQAGDAGGAIFASDSRSREIVNSTFVENIATNAAAVLFSEGGLIANSTFWNNGDADTYSISANTSDTYFFSNILANDTSDTVMVIDPTQTTTDLGANLYTDSSFDDTTTGDGSSNLVTVGDLKLSAPALNQSSPANLGTTETVAIGADSIARDYYSATSPGAADGATRNNLAATDQRGAFRPFGTGYDVGAFEIHRTVSPSPSTSPELVVTETIADQRIAFAPGSSKLSAASKNKLRTLAAEIKSKGLKSVKLSGHTATLTKAAPSGKVFRVKLSKARTAAVQSYLMQELKKSNYSVAFTKSLKGAANPLKSNKTEKGRKDNRRVEITIK